ncbi:MAG: SGNH/GDSL hydrolase family protein [Ruminococcus sp.]|nr:SGNH/GDSL hydrolase family protein [Ruminococcus sp.]MCM1381727.1 SGNH/GDSL hydrolase family protein [Muribaculaceae bacterium]MCM1480104.1 SGNH/GDSL hydrolase family protein [Muribaculaceae bacterium]
MSEKIKRTLAAAAAVMMCCTALTGCGNGETAENTPSESVTAADNGGAETTAAEVTEPAENNEVDPSVPVNLEEGVTDKMYSRAIMNEGNTARLAAAMKKAQNGEEITVGVIGGSITQGSLASSPANCYASKFNDWWVNKFPNAKINFVNAGIGGTNSYLGVHRVDGQLLAYDPDAVIVEFSVNDTDALSNRNSYDSLVRKILAHGSNPGVILLFTTMEDGTSLQDVHKEIGEAYDLPMISYHDVVYPEVAAGTLAWKDISPDNIHPNDAGHDIINQLVSRYLDGIYDSLDSIADEPAAFTDAPLTGDYYANAKMLSAADITADMNGFEVVEKDFYDQFHNNWKTTAGGSMTFEIECRNLGMFFMCTVDGKSGKFEVYVDGERKGTLNADFSGGWGNYGETRQVLLGKETAKHTVEIKPAEGSEEKGITVLGVMAS